MSTISPPQEDNFIGRFLNNLQDKLQFIFNDIQTDYQTIPEGSGKSFLKKGQLALIFLYIVVTILLIVYAIFYRIDKAKLSRIELPYNIETISYQALDFTHPKYKGKYQYFPILLFVSIILVLTISVFILSIIKFTNFKVKAFYFMMAIILLIPVIIYIILYANISKYLKPRNEAKEKINDIFYKYMIDDLNAKNILSIIPDGGRYSNFPMIQSLKILADQTGTETENIKIQKLTKAIITFTLYKYYIQKSMEDYLLERALADTFNKYSIKKIDYCKYLPNTLRSLTTFDISKIVNFTPELSRVFTSNSLNIAKKSANIILREVNGYLDKIHVNEDIIKKFIMTNTIIWIIFMMMISIILIAVMKFQPNTI
uniref:Uncharacterized protein n=1 Tax=viral metagenome TaxID=1070528 RepID=A0A6C0CRZ1_9ZZZZ